VVLSGSLPVDTPADALVDLVEQAHAHRRPVIVDTSGPALAAALAARPTLVKPNADELAELTGAADPRDGAAHLARTHGIGVVASLGPDGLVAVDERGSWQARPARPLVGNPTGAGDAVVAALARGLARGETLPEMLADAVAVSAAAVLQPHAGHVHPDDVDSQRRGVVVTRLGADGAV
jgi:tagatose 6-phosphate kinase